MKSITISLLFCLLLASCGDKQYAEIIFTNGNIYTVDTSNEWAESMAIRGDQLFAIGLEKDVLATKGPATQIIDLNGQFVMPGIIEGHGHFGGIGKMLMAVLALRRMADCN